MSDDINRQAYVEVSATAAMRRVPRFGHSSDFSKIFASKEDATDYIYGLLFAGIMVIALFFAWTVIILVFKCLGKKKVGFLSGSPFVKSSARRSYICRIVYLFAALCLMIFSITFVTEGLANLRTSVTTVIASTRNINSVVKDVDAVIKDVRSFGSNASDVRDEFLRILSVETGGLECVAEQEALDPNNTGRNITQVLTTLKEVFTEMGNFQPDETDELLNAIEYIMDLSQAVEDEAHNIEIGDWQSLIIVIPYIVVPMLLVVGVVLSYLGIQIPMLQCVLTWVVHPIFIIQVIFACCLSGAILITASANADFCSGGEGKQRSPNQTVENIMQSLGYNQDDLIYTILTFYIGQCTSETPFDFLDTYKETIGNVNALVVEFANAVTAAATTSLSEVCSEVTALDKLNAVIIKNLAGLLNNVKDMQEILKCSNIVTLYTDPVYDGTCTYSITGVTWAWASFAVVGAMGLVMIMLRSAWKIDVEADPYGNDGSTIHGEFTVDQGLETKTVDDVYTSYDPEKDGDNPFEQSADANGLEYKDSSNLQDQTNIEGEYAAGAPETNLHGEDPMITAQY